MEKKIVSSLPLLPCELPVSAKENHDRKKKSEIITVNNNGIEVMFKNSAPFTDWINEINNTQLENAKYIDAVMPMYNLIKYSDDLSKTFGSLWQYYRDEPSLNENGVINDFRCTSASFKFKQKIGGETEVESTKEEEGMK